MKKRYKLYPISNYILLGESGSVKAKLYKLGLNFTVYEIPVLVINKTQCTRIIKKFGKSYYRIEVI